MMKKLLWMLVWIACPLQAAEKFVVVMDWLPSWKHAGTRHSARWPSWKAG